MSQAPTPSLEPSPLPTYIYKILPSAPPTPLPAALPLSPLDATDGFIHLSTAPQVPGTASRFFTESTSLWLLKIRLDRFPPYDTRIGGGRIVWERAGNAGVFPHLYNGDLGEGVVERVLVLERREGEGWGEVFEREGLEG